MIIIRIYVETFYQLISLKAAKDKEKTGEYAISSD